jgi:hypothetical protein
MPDAVPNMPTLSSMFIGTLNTIPTDAAPILILAHGESLIRCDATG